MALFFFINDLLIAVFSRDMNRNIEKCWKHGKEKKKIHLVIIYIYGGIV